MSGDLCKIRNYSTYSRTIFLHYCRKYMGWAHGFLHYQRYPLLRAEFTSYAHNAVTITCITASQTWWLIVFLKRIICVLLIEIIKALMFIQLLKQNDGKYVIFKNRLVYCT